MTRPLTVKKLMKRFAADQKGTLAVMTGIAAVPLMLAAGAAIDFVRYNSAQTEVQAALDAGALAAASGKGISDTARISAAKATFDHNIQSGGLSGMSVEADFKVIDDRIVSSAEINMPTSFMAIAGIGSLTGVSSAEVGILADKKAEVVLVLDYSTSMDDAVDGKTKYIVMRDAATKLVKDLAKSDAEKVKIGLVPFSHMVHTTLPSAYAVGGSGASWTGCTQDRKYPHNLTADTPGSSNATKWNQPLYNDPYQLSYTCSGTKAKKHKLVDLTDDFKSVTQQLDVMKPYGYTHIALGVEFGYHILSPNAPFTKGAKLNDDETKKFMVVLTDGKQTAGAFGKNGARDPDSGRANLEKLCSNAKADGITIITMAFDLDDAATMTRLQNCATNPAKDYFVANNSSDLASAFDSVKAAVTAEIYLSK